MLPQYIGFEIINQGHYRKNNGGNQRRCKHSAEQTGKHFFVGNPSIREATYEAVFGISLDEAMDQDTNYTKHGFLTAFALNFGALNMTEPQHYPRKSSKPRSGYARSRS